MPYCSNNESSNVKCVIGESEQQGDQFRSMSNPKLSTRVCLSCRERKAAYGYRNKDRPKTKKKKHIYKLNSKKESNTKELILYKWTLGDFSSTKEYNEFAIWLKCLTGRWKE